MTKLYFVRHGKTQWNLEGRYQGAQGDSPLLPSSLAEIGELADFLAPITFNHLYTSPLPRALTTAKTLKTDLQQAFPVTIVPDLHEFNLGKMEGMAFTEVAQKYPRTVQAFRKAPQDYDPTEIQGETFTQVIDRTTKAVNQIVQQAGTNDHIIIVSHGAALVALIQGLLGTPLANIRQRGGLTNSSVTTVETTNQGQSYQLLKWNETQFLSRQLTATDTI